MVDVNLELILDFPIDHSLNWKSLIDTLDINHIFEKKYQKYNEENVINFLFEEDQLQLNAKLFKHGQVQHCKCKR